MFGRVAMATIQLPHNSCPLLRRFRLSTLGALILLVSWLQQSLDSVKPRLITTTLLYLVQRQRSGHRAEHSHVQLNSEGV